MTTDKSTPQPTGPLWGLWSEILGRWIGHIPGNHIHLYAFSTANTAIAKASRYAIVTRYPIIVAQIPDPRVGPAWIVDRHGVRDYTFPEEPSK